MNQWDDAQWRKADVSGDHGCVEVAFAGGKVGVRDSKDGGRGPVLAFTEHEWACFLDGAGKGEFNLPQ